MISNPDFKSSAQLWEMTDNFYSNILMHVLEHLIFKSFIFFQTIFFYLSKQIQ